MRDPFPATVEVKKNPNGNLWIEIVAADGSRWWLQGAELTPLPDEDGHTHESVRVPVKVDVTPKPKALGDGG